MSNMNNRQRKIAYARLKKFGAYCRGCQALESEKELIIDHKDNNNSNNHPSNLQFLCRSCNYIKNPRLAERPLDVCVGEKVGECDLFSKPTEISINMEKEPEFREYVIQHVAKNSPMKRRELVNASSERIGIAQKTSIRYLDKMCSYEGKFIIRKVGKQVCLRNLSELTKRAELPKLIKIN